MHYYKKNIGDYFKKAGRLSMLEHGAYTLLIDSCYDRERFPTRDEAIDWAWARTGDEIVAVDFVLAKFFKLTDGVYVQDRILEELHAYHAQAETNKRIATEREAKRTKRERSVNETPEKSNDSSPNQEPRTIEPITINQKKQSAPQVLNTVGAAASKTNQPEEPPFPDIPPWALPAEPLPDTSHNPTQAGAIAGDLRRRGVTVTASHPTLLAWVRDGIFLPQLIDALEVAKMRKSAGESINPGYIDAIVRSPNAGKPAAPVDRWWDSDKGIDRKAKEVGIRANGSDTYNTLKDKIFSQLKAGKTEERQSA